MRLRTESSSIKKSIPRLCDLGIGPSELARPIVPHCSASARGIAMSRKFSHCAVKKTVVGGIDSLLAREEVAIAILAYQCNVTCSDNDWDWKDDWYNPLKCAPSSHDFFFLNERLMWDKHVSPYYEGITTDEEEQEVPEPFMEVKEYLIDVDFMIIGVLTY